MNNPVSRKTMENVRKNRDIKHVTTNRRKSLLVSEPNYYTTKWKNEVKMNKTVYLGLSVLGISKIAM